jgi:2'-5' RNA ligase
MPTIGVAIAVPEPYGEQLRGLRASFGDLQAADIPTHVTLLPPSQVDDDALERVEEQLERVADKHSSFDMRLRGTATFRPISPVVFVVVSQGISQCEMLAESLRDELEVPPAAFPYHPHVTVAHDVPDDALDLAYDTLSSYDAHFSVDAFSLYVHDPRAGWECVRELHLRGSSSQPWR